MSEKHFIKLAEWIRDYNRDDNATAGPNFDDRQIAMLADFYEEQNPLFKRDRWIADIKGECGKNGGAK